MLDATGVRALRNTLALVPASWVLWVLDANERYVFLEGPCLERIGVRPAERLGRTLEEANPGQPDIVAWGRKYMRMQGTDLAVIRGQTLLLSGAPARGGGCVGIGILLEGSALEHADAPAQVLELACDLPGAGARRGDLVVVDVARPGRVGLYREIDVALLGTVLEQEISGINSPTCVATPPARPKSGSRPRAPGAHLRLVP